MEDEPEFIWPPFEQDWIYLQIVEDIENGIIPF